ncbi:MAG TPA: hypothetical protein VKB56_04845 [Terriglobales bacterium]|nr:hypothetical protein [Terriglobales bacterium]
MRVLDRYELNAYTAPEQVSNDVAAFRCQNAHVFFVSLAKFEPHPDQSRSLSKAAGQS